MQKTMLLLLIILLCVGCKKNSQQGQSGESTETTIAQRERTEQDEPRDRGNQSSNSSLEIATERISAVSEEPFPVDRWFFLQSYNPPLSPSHKTIGILMGYENSSDEVELHSYTRELFLETKATANKYSESGIALLLEAKVEHISQGLDLIVVGKPIIQGAVGEVSFYLSNENEETHGIVYWFFDQGKWMLEDVTVE